MCRGQSDVAISSPNTLVVSETSNNTIGGRHQLMVKNNDLRRLLELQRNKYLNQRRNILKLKKENSQVNKQLSLRHSFKSRFWKTKLKVRENTSV